MVCIIHDLFSQKSVRVLNGDIESALPDFAFRFRYSLDGENLRNVGLATRLLREVDSLGHPSDSGKALVISSKLETEGCLQAKDWRPVVCGIDPQGNLIIEKNNDPSYELKTLVFAAKIRNKADYMPNSKHRDDEPVILLAFHCRADHNIINSTRLESEVNRLFADTMGRRGKRISLMDETEFMYHYNNKLTDYLGIAKGEINPFSIIDVAEQKQMPIITFLDSSISESNQAIATNWCRRTLSIRFPSGKDLYGRLTAMAASEELARNNIVDGVALPLICEAPNVRFFFKPHNRMQLDHGWEWSPKALAVDNKFRQ